MQEGNPSAVWGPQAETDPRVREAAMAAAELFYMAHGLCHGSPATVPLLRGLAQEVDAEARRMSFEVSDDADGEP